MRKIILAVFFLVGCASTSNLSSHSDGPGKLSILSDSSRMGELEPCGCTVNTLGGLVRQENVFAKWRANFKNHLTVTSGMAFVPQKFEMLKDHPEQQKVKGQFIIKALNELGMQVMSVSANDLAMGLPYILSLRDNAKFKMVSANLIHAKTKKPIFDETAEFQFEGTKVVVTGVTKYGWEQGWVMDSGAMVARPEEKIAAILAKVPESSFVVLLSDLPAADRDELLEKFPKIRVVVGASENAGQAAELRGTTALRLDNEGRARAVSRTTVDLGPATVPFYDEKFSAHVAKERAWKKDRIVELEKKYAATKDESAYRTMLNLKYYMEDTKTVPTTAPAKYLGYTFETVPLDESWEKPENKITPIITAYKAKVRELALSDDEE